MLASPVVCAALALLHDVCLNTMILAAVERLNLHACLLRAFSRHVGGGNA